MQIIELFKEISKIPRCSKTHQPFIKFLKDFSSKLGYECKVDQANNILCYKKDSIPKICLQAHYDMVCLEEGKVPTVLEKEGYLVAKDSTLGADNAIGCAYMLALMKEQVSAEYLFTCDEEIGLIGANNITHELRSKKMLNLDSEAQGEICIGCAGGVDIYGINKKSEYLNNEEDKDLFEIEVKDLQGGHSGVDIDKNIPNAIKLIAQVIKKSQGELIDIKGGERINSIPKYVKAIVLSKNTPTAKNKNIQISKIDTKTKHYKKLDNNIINFLYTFSNGVRDYDKNLGVVLSSINLALVDNTIDGLKVALSARSMDNEQLEILKDETVELLKLFGFETSTQGKYPAWKPQENSFTKEVLKSYKKFIPNTELKAIHAGLECAVFKSKYPDIEICSIGPNIHFPHSNKEMCEIDSVLKIYEVIKDILEN